MGFGEELQGQSARGKSLVCQFDLVWTLDLGFTVAARPDKTSEEDLIECYTLPTI